MPYGITSYPPPVPGLPVPPTIVPVHPESMPAGSSSRAERQAGSDFWQHDTLDPSDFPTGEASIDYSRGTNPVAVAIYAAAGDALYVRMNGTAGTGAGSYDLFHPGGGWLSCRIPAAATLSFATATGNAPANRVEVIAAAGIYVLT